MISVIEQKIKQGRVIESSRVWVKSHLNRVVRRDFTKKVALRKYMKLLRQRTMCVSGGREHQAGEIF